jgi:hypothetical protein
MFLMLDIGFFSLVLILIAAKWYLKTQQTTTVKQAKTQLATYKSEYAELSLTGKNDKTIDGIHSREIELRTATLDRDHLYRMEVLRHETDLEYTQYGLLGIVVLTYIGARMKKLTKAKT